jgi:hypothetical protein
MSDYRFQDQSNYYNPQNQQGISDLKLQDNRLQAYIAHSDRPIRIPRLVGPTVRNLALMAVGGIMIGTAVALIDVVKTGTGAISSFLSLITTAQPAAKVDTRSLVVQQVRGVSELTTAVFTMETVVPTSQERTVGNFVIGKTTLLYIAYGEVRAGIDLVSLTPSDVQISGNTVLLHLPPPKILDSKIDVDRSKVYDYDRGFLGLGPDAAPELQALAQRETLKKIVKTACTQGVLQTANDRAKQAIGQLLATAGYKHISIDTQLPSSETCTFTAPEPPTDTIPSTQPDSSKSPG